MKLEINQLTKSYSKGKKALDSFTLTLETVSYTHLDVYKRQLTDSASIRDVLLFPTMKTLSD